MVYFVLATALGIIGFAAAYFVLRPIWDFRTTRGAIAHALTEFGNVDTPDDARIPQARATYRDLANALKARMNSIPYYTLWSSLKIVPTFAEIDKASANLMGLSNIVGLQTERYDKNILQRNIETALHLN